MSSPPSPQSESTQVEQLRWAEMRIQSLEKLLRLARIAKYGAASEKLNSAQLELLEFEPGVSGEEVEAESKREPIAPAATQRKRKQLQAVKHCPLICHAWNDCCPAHQSNAHAGVAAVRQWSLAMSRASS